MTETARLRLPEIAAAQAQKHVTHNEALVALDTLVQLSVIDKDLATPPGEPQEGDCHIVADAATDAWTGWEGRVARYEDGAWRSCLPGAGDGEGWLAYVQDEATLYVRASGAWVSHLGGVPGAWTPEFTFATPGDLAVSYNTQIGRLVHYGAWLQVFFYIDFTPTFSTASGNARLSPTGLPGFPNSTICFPVSWRQGGGGVQSPAFPEDVANMQIQTSGPDTLTFAVINDSGGGSFTQTNLGDGHFTTGARYRVGGAGFLTL